MCVCVCVCVCVCYGEVAASISSLANWCMVLCIYIYICKCTNVHIEIVWVCCIHSAQLQTLWVIDFMLSGLSLLCLVPQSGLLQLGLKVYASVPRCMPGARLGLIHNTMPSHIRTLFSKSLVNVWMCGMYVHVHACVCACHKGRIESLRLSLSTV